MIKVRFTCLPCGLRNQLVDVPARESPNVDVRRYMESIVASAITACHRVQSPNCTASKMTFVALPFDPSDQNVWIGKQTDAIPPALDDSGKPLE